MIIIVIYLLGLILSAVIFCSLNIMEIIPDDVYEDTKVIVCAFWFFSMFIGFGILACKAAESFIKFLASIFRE